MTQPIRHVCRHIARDGKVGTTLVHQTAVPGETRSDIDEETTLCAVCSGAIVAILVRIESLDVPSDWNPLQGIDA